LLWRDPRRIPLLDIQDVVIEVVRDPSFHEPSETVVCGWFVRMRLAHDRDCVRGGCGEGEHLVAAVCSVHGPENLEAHPLMHRFPTGFTPALTPDRFAELENALYPEGCTCPPGPDADTITGRTRERTTAWQHAANAPRSTHVPNGDR